MASHEPWPPQGEETEHTIVPGIDESRVVGLDQKNVIHQLVVTDGLEPGRRIKVEARPLVLGRTPPADVVLADGEVSRAHCKVAAHEGEVTLTDLGSTNGTFVDGERITGSVTLQVGNIVVVGRQVLRYERVSLKEASAVRELDRELEKARRYVEALLPPPLLTGAVRTEWTMIPSAQLGGDAFGYQQLDARTFALYLLDVSGHGTSSAMLAVTATNVIRQRAIPATDFRDPAAVLKALNVMFQMEQHGDMYFTLWYGVYDTVTRRLTFASAGHHPAYLVPPTRKSAVSLWSPGSLMIGAYEDAQYTASTVEIPPGSGLYVFSDGVFEVVALDGRRWELEDFVPLLTEPATAGVPESRRLLARMQRVQGRPNFEDDFTMLVASFE